MDTSLQEDLWILLAGAPGTGTVTAQYLFKKFGSIEAVWNAGEAALTRCRIRKDTAAYLLRGPDLPKARRDREQWLNEQIQVITRASPLYPPLLQEISDPPILLFAKGRTELLRTDMMAVVGARRCSGYGQSKATRLGRELSMMGYTVVSGMASGIDTCAHQGALEAGGDTVAVLGCGVDICYPPDNYRLYSRLLEEGLVISEYEPHTKPLAGMFPPRNRIISGMSHGVVVVEGSEKSGSLITAGQALDQGRDVYAVPGPIDSFTSRGVHRLVQNGGAMILCDFTDIPSLTGRTPQTATDAESVEPEDPVERLVYRAVPAEGATMEALLGCGLDIQTLQQTLSMLEIQGLIEQAADRRWLRTPAK